MAGRHTFRDRGQASSSQTGTQTPAGGTTAHSLPDGDTKMSSHPASRVYMGLSSNLFHGSSLSGRLPPSPVGVGLARSKEHHSRRRTRDTIRWHSHLVRSLGSPNPRAASPWLWWLKRPEWLESHWGLQKYFGSCQELHGGSVSAPAALGETKRALGELENSGVLPRQAQRRSPSGVSAPKKGFTKLLWPSSSGPCLAGQTGVRTGTVVAAKLCLQNQMRGEGLVSWILLRHHGQAFIPGLSLP